MSTFAFNVKVNDPFADVTDAALGTAGQGWGDEEIGKAVKLSTANNYVLCSDGDPMEGFVCAVEPNTVNAGVSFGAVQRNKRVVAVLDTGETGVTVGTVVVAGAQAAVGTANASSAPVVAAEPVPGTSAGNFIWRVIRLIDGGDAGDRVLIERV